MSEKFPQVFGRYQLKERLALGGMAELFLAEVEGAHGFAKSVVIKRILPQLAEDAQFTSMFISEAKFTAQLSHPNIAQTLELCNEGKQLFIVMEYIDGLDALALLRECAHRRSRVPAELSVYIIKEVLDALDFAHKLRSDDGKPLGIVHRDVSPSNIILSTRGDVKLIDFGIAHAMAETGKTNTGTLKGKYGYMSPEQVLGQSISPQSDIFAAGVVLAEMLMGRRLFAAANELDVLLMVRDVDLGRLERFGGHIEAGLVKLLRRALAKKSEDRFADAGEFRDVLDEWLFDQRHRVTNSNLAKVVASLYSDALVRRKEGLKNSPVVHAAEKKAAAVEFDLAIDDAIESALVDSAAERRIRSMAVGTAKEESFYPKHAKGTGIEDLLEGVPSGLGERAPTDGPSIEISRAGSDLDERAASVSVRAESASERAGSAADERAGSAADKRAGSVSERAGSSAEERVDSVLERAASASERVDSASERAGSSAEERASSVEEEQQIRSATPRAETAVASPQSQERQIERTKPKLAKVLDDLPILEDSIDSDEDNTGVGTIDFPGYNSISAAVASVSPLAPDPASKEFDDSKVAGEKEHHRPTRMPTPHEWVAPPAARANSEGQQESEKNGSLGELSALGILFRTTANRSSGKVVLTFSGLRKVIYFKRGVPEFVSSNIASELFGAYLVRTEAIGSGELDMALAVMPHFGGKLGDTLVGLGLMKPLEVFRHLTRQVRSKLIEVCTWTQGEYEWFSDADCPEQAFPLDLDAHEVYGAGAMAMPRGSLENWGRSNANIKPVAAEHSTLRLDLFQVSGMKSYQASLTGDRCLGHIVENTPDTPQGLHQLRLLYLLINTRQAVEFDGEFSQ